MKLFDTSGTSIFAYANILSKTNLLLVQITLHIAIINVSKKLNVSMLITYANILSKTNLEM